MPDETRPARPYLSPVNSEKVKKISHELNLSESEVINRIVESVTTFELYQIIKFGIKTDDLPDRKPRRIILKRKNFATKF